MKKNTIIGGIAGILVVSLAAALFWKPGPSSTGKGFAAVSLAEARRGDFKVWLDARPPRAFMEGHYPGSINIPATWRGEEIERQIANIREKHDGDKILIYCNPPPCKDSGILANHLNAGGIKNIAILIEGYVAERN